MLQVQSSKANQSRLGASLLAGWLVSTLLWWALAFYPLPPMTPDWIAQAREVCFGALPNGLPANYGWMLLLLGPASLIAAIWIGFDEEVRTGKSLFFTSKGFAFAGVALFILTGIEAIWVGKKIASALKSNVIPLTQALPEELPSSYPRTAKPLPEFQLVNQRGEIVTPEVLRGKVTVLTYVFAHCTTVCPTLVERVKESYRFMDPAQVNLLLITLDPWRDTPKSLPSLAERWQLPMNSHLASGVPKSVTSLLDALSVPWKRDEKTGDVQHPALVQVLDANAKIAFTFNNPNVGWLIAAVRRASSE